MKNEIDRVTARKAPVFEPRRLATLATIALIGAVVAPELLAQSVGAPGKPLAFEVASVKLHTSDDQQIMMVAQPGGRFTARNVPLRFLIRTAYQLQDDQISGGPNWITTDRFDILAKADEGAPTTQLPSMLQTLLVDRFKLTAHREMRDLPIYALVVVRNDGALGSALRPTACPSVDIDLSRPQPCANISNGRGQLFLRGMPFSQFLPFLAPYVNRVVVDRTGLTGRYDIDLKWTPERQTQGPGTSDVLAIDPDGLSIFTAIQEQLGLKLDSTKGPVEVVVIDSVDHPTPD